ncbi:hypothetical protein OAU50_01940 [Planctomycetota bacterium]|nr:hypothetical protein [Planctomycetota bacterium]
MRNFAILMLAILAMPLLAQLPPELPPEVELPEANPSAEKESFVVMPATVERGENNVEIRLANNTPAGYSHSSSRAPELKVGAGATLVVGSFTILNTNDAKAILNIEDDTASTISLSVNIFSVNGSTILRTFQATIGVTGQSAVTGSAASIGATEVKLVQVNVDDEQAAGSIRISGSIAGTVTITAPTGTTFANMPSTTSTADINSPALSQGNLTFSFSIGNAASADVIVNVTDIVYNAKYFTIAGGVEGDLALEVTGGALSNQSALVVNAFTAKSTIEGTNDNDAQPPAVEEEGSEESESTSNGGSVNNSNNSGSSNRRGLDNSNRNNNGRKNNKTNSNNSGRSPVAAGRLKSPPPPPPSVPRFGSRKNINKRGKSVGGSGAAPIIGKGGPSSGEGDGTAKIVKPDGPKTEDSHDQSGNKLKLENAKPRKLITTPGLYFTNKNFEPVTAVVMNKFVSDEAGGRIWIVLKKEKNDTAKAETVKVKLTIGGSSRELSLIETSKDSGVFRCSSEGILIVSNEDPDSNREEPRQSDPKPRFQ